MEEKLQEQEVFRREKIKQLKQLKVDPYGQKYIKKDTSKDLKQKYNSFSKEELSEKEIKVSIAGRVMTLRNMGKASFFTIQDREGKIQVYLRKDSVSEEKYNIFSLVDLGDIVGVKGILMKTNTGELSIKALEYQHLSKSLKPLPEKFHGLVDLEQKTRKRYLDLIVNEDSKKTAILRSKIIKETRSFLDARDFLEVETPILHPVLGGASARPFITHHNSLDMPFYLRIAPELYLKRLLVGGLERVYEINRNFRNEGISNRHNPEFTMLELYEAFGNLESMMDIVDEMFLHLIKILNLDLKQIKWGNLNLDFSKGFKRVSMIELIKESIDVDFSVELSDEEAVLIAKNHNIFLEEHEKNFGHIVNKFFEKYCEDKLVQPTILYGHPSIISPLAKPSKEDKRFAQRFEIFIGGIEFGNAYGELNDPLIQKENFLNQLKEKEKGNSEANEMDLDFLEALEYGMPPAGGLGVGMDRVVMLFTNKENIREVLLFPHMKSKN